MRPSNSVLAIAAVSVILAGSAVLGCKGGSPTSPYGGGSMGGGGSGSGNTPFSTGSLNAPASFVHVFPTAGNVGYHCEFHVSMGMTGTVSVVAGGPDSAVVTGSGTSSSPSTFSPSTVSIKPGGYVHWKITSGTHTVTSN